jgi:DNA-binding phage protein
MATTQNATSSYHDRRLARRMQDPEFREAFERETAEVTAIDAVVNTLDELRAERGISKAELAREIGKNPAAIRRMLTLAGANPELRTVVAMANALDADIQIVPRKAVKSAAKTRKKQRAAEAV